tara:strand:- start:2224 stop:3360 length:1137 start_codon:yes stop_codon:yes gene_type:complete
MAVYKLFPTKDASIYTENISMNTGLDQIAEASTYIYQGDPHISRYLIDFSTSEISDIINNKISGSSFKTYLNSYAATVTGLNTNTKLYSYPISGSWDMGTGHFRNSPITSNGVSWKYQAYSGSTEWATSSFNTYSTASYSTKIGGGTWYTGSNLGLNVVHSQSFNYSDNIDISLDVTNTINTWNSNSIDSNNGFPNNGFIIKQGPIDEFNISLNNSHTFRYFSIDTNTIYPPQLEFRWDDYIFNTGSSTNTILSKAESFINIYNNTGIYYPESIARFRLAAIPKYPDREFITSSYYTQNYYLPEEVSSYAIKDTDTNEFVINFDSSYTKISADETSSYFDVYMSGLEPERYYTVLIKTKLDNTTKVFDENVLFKVSKG